MDIFESKCVAPMLIGHNQAAFDSEDYVYELKLDGIRCVAYLCEDGTELRNKRNKCLAKTFPELGGINRQVKERCVLDGELVVFKDGKPNFYEVQRRSLMTNPIRIGIAARKLSVSFTAFDILYIGNKAVNALPLMERKSILRDTVTESEHISISQYIERDGIAFYKAAAEMGLEGIVAKKKDSRYYFGKTTNDWIKMKALLDEDFVVCGYFRKGAHTVSVIIGAYDVE